MGDTCSLVDVAEAPKLLGEPMSAMLTSIWGIGPARHEHRSGRLDARRGHQLIACVATKGPLELHLTYGS
jgi:hypothetical protein